jgi:hypothetical protein
MVSGWLRRNQSPELELDKEILENNGESYLLEYTIRMYKWLQVWATEIPKRQFSDAYSR